MNIDKYSIAAVTLIALIFLALFVDRYAMPALRGEGSFGHHEVCSPTGCLMRGEIATEGPLEFMLSTVHLDVDTELEITSTQSDDEFTTLRTGRMHTIGQHVVLVPDTRIVIDGSVSVIHYSWLGEAEVIAQEGRADVIIGESVFDLSAEDALRFNYRDGTIVSKKNDADLLNSQRSAFYESILTPQD